MVGAGGRGSGAEGPCGAMAAESALHGTRRNRSTFRDCQDSRRARILVAELRSEPRARPRATRTSRTMMRAKVLKMLAMEQSGASQGAPQAGRTAADPVEDFLTTGRTGRRNAMANIMGQHANTGSGDIAQRMDGLAIDQMEAGPSGAGSSGAGPSGCSETQQATAGAAPEQGR